MVELHDEVVRSTARKLNGTDKHFNVAQLACGAAVAMKILWTASGELSLSDDNYQLIVDGLAQVALDIL